MVDGFHWTRVTSKQLRFLYEAVTMSPAPPHMYELAAKLDAALSRPKAAPQQPPALGSETGTSPKRKLE